MADTETVDAERQLTFMEVRLFRLAQKRWGVDSVRCADIFERNDVPGYVRDAWENFHVQGDDACLDDIERYLEANGVSPR